LGYAHFNWSLIGEPVLGVISILDGLILVGMALTDNIWMAYLGYWAFRALYQMLITVAR
jgi:thiamine transporter 2/3